MPKISLEIPEGSIAEWEKVATDLADAFAFMRRQNGAALFPAREGMAWYEAVLAYEKLKYPKLRATPAAIDERYPGRG